MSNENRQIVQESLDRKAAARKQRMKDADHDAAERKLHAEINRRTQARWEAMEAAEADQRRKAAEEAAKARRIEHHQAQDAKRNAQWNTYLLRTSICVIIAAFLDICYAIDAIAFWLALPGMLLASAFCVVNIVAYCTRNMRKDEPAYRQVQ